MQDTKLSSLYTTDTNKMRMHIRHINTQINRIQRSEQWNYQEQLEDQRRHMHDCNKNRNMQLTPNLKWDSRLKQEIFLDFFGKLSGKRK